MCEREREREREREKALKFSRRITKEERGKVQGTSGDELGSWE